LKNWRLSPHPETEIVMAWIYLAVAGLLEVVWAYLMKASDGFSKPWTTGAMVVAMIASFQLLAMAMKTLPLGTAYAVWTGVGAVGAFLVGLFVLGEAATPMRIGSAALILAGIVGLRLSA
jgi:quaternary ammonium compound-resistance protein SugE